MVLSFDHQSQEVNSLVAEGLACGRRIPLPHVSGPVWTHVLPGSCFPGSMALLPR